MRRHGTVRTPASSSRYFGISSPSNIDRHTNDVDDHLSISTLFLSVVSDCVSYNYCQLLKNNGIKIGCFVVATKVVNKQSPRQLFLNTKLFTSLILFFI
jgi:hypothetical protein